MIDGDSAQGREHSGKIRSIFLGSFVAVVLVIFLIRLLDLQLIRGREYKRQSERVSRQAVPIPAQRGRIYDHNGEVLVNNTDLFAIRLTPSAAYSDSMERYLTDLAKILDMSQTTMNRKVPPRLYRSFRAIELKSGVSFETVAYLAENTESFPGVSWYSRPKRSYVQDGSIAHVLGYVGEITGEELQTRYNLGYREGDLLGKSGVERQYDRELQGKPGVRYYSVDAGGRRVQEDRDPTRLPVNGKNLYLSIDMNIQRLANDALANRKGSVVVLRPATGEILAMVSKPAFNANTFEEKGPRGFAAQSLDPSFPFINRAIAAEYPPASTFKIVMEAASLEHKALDPSVKIFCPGYMRVGSKVFHCYLLSGHGYEDLSKALADSCDVYFWTLGKDYLGSDENGRPDPIKITKQAQDFGYGSLTEVDLPGEKPGNVPDKEWKDDTFHAIWTGGDTMNMSIGQGFLLTTPLQVANAFAMVANGGVAYKPHVLRYEQDPATGKLTYKESEILHTSPVAKETWTRLQSDLRGVVTNGTGWMLNKVTQAAGKTGTGEIGIDGQYHDWFACYAPYQTDNPKERVVVVVQAEAGQTYTWWSSKVADFILQGIFAKQNYSQVLRTIKPFYMNWKAVADGIDATRAALTPGGRVEP